jgi:hypothetical protein
MRSRRLRIIAISIRPMMLIIIGLALRTADDINVRNS